MGQAAHLDWCVGSSPLISCLNIESSHTFSFFLLLRPLRLSPLKRSAAIMSSSIRFLLNLMVSKSFWLQDYSLIGSMVGIGLISSPRTLTTFHQTTLEVTGTRILSNPHSPLTLSLPRYTSRVTYTSFIIIWILVFPLL